jgi:RHS repeat-associated protein
MTMKRTMEYRYNVDGLLEELVCRNGKDEQVTRWEYGVELYAVSSVSCGVARNDLVRAKIYPDGGDDRVEYTYDRLGETVKFADQNGSVHEYMYDTIGRVTADKVMTLGGGVDGAVRAIGVSYTLRGEVEKVTSYDDVAMGSGDVVNEMVYAYNGFGQVTNEDLSQTGVSTVVGMYYLYESPAGVPNTIRRTALWSNTTARGTGYAYDGNAIDNRLDRLSMIVGDPDGTPYAIATYAWLGAGTPAFTSYSQPGVLMTAVKTSSGDPNGDAGDQYIGLDRFGRLEDARWRKSGDDIERVEYGFDRVGNRTWRRNRIAPDENFDEHYAYDGLYQVTGLARGKLNQNRTAIGGVPTWAEGWRYDEMGNWLGYTANGDGTDLDQRRTYNAANELLMLGEGNGPLLSTTLAHDPAGNMTRMPKVDDWDVAQVLKWDAWNRLVEITQMEGGSTVSKGKYAYDGLSRRIYKERKEGGVTVKRYFANTDQWQVMEEFTGSGTPVALTLERSFVWGAKMLDDLILRDIYNSGGTVTSRYYALNDGKNVTAIVNTSGVVQERYAYTGFGYTEVLEPDFDPREDNESDFGWETRFCGYRWDQESGLYQVRYRYYHPQFGRWISRDPIGEREDGNLFKCMLNCPMNHVDSLGLSPFTDCLSECLVGHYDELTIGALFLSLGLPILPKRPALGASGGTSIASVGSRFFWGDLILEKSMWAPTLKHPFSKAGNFGAVVGRWIPFVGGLVLTVEVLTYGYA